jgi:hypothetical protein
MMVVNNRKIKSNMKALPTCFQFFHGRWVGPGGNDSGGAVREEGGKSSHVTHYNYRVNRGFIDRWTLSKLRNSSDTF